MNSFIERLKRNNPSIFWLLAVSLGLSVFGLLLNLVQPPQAGSHGLPAWLMMPSHARGTIAQPWGIFTYVFITPLKAGYFLSFIFNLVFIYQFGRILQSFIGEKKVKALIIFGIFFNAVVVLLICTLLPGAQKGEQFLFGLSGISVTLIAAAITVAPKYPLQLMLLGRVAILWVGIVLIGFKFISPLTLASWPEMISLISAIVLGYGHIQLARKGTDIPGSILEYFEEIFQKEEKKPRLKVVYRKSTDTKLSHEEKVNLILDRINEVGYEELTREEKEILAGLSDDEK